MVETGAVAGQANANFGQQKKIEGAERNIARQDNKNGANTVAAGNDNAGNRTKVASPERTEAKVEGVRTSVESNIQRQANNLNAANNVAGTAQKERGQNINEFV